MSKATSDNYTSAIDKYNELAAASTGADALKAQYTTASELASENAKTVQDQKYKSYLSQGMNPAKAARMASKDASESFETSKNTMANALYEAERQKSETIGKNEVEAGKVKDDTKNQNKGRVLGTIGGVVSGVANALSDENAKNIGSEKTDLDELENILGGI